MFLEMADGVDDETWEWHRARGDFSEWVASSIRDADGSVKNLGRYAASWIAWWPNRPSSRVALT